MAFQRAWERDFRVAQFSQMRKRHLRAMLVIDNQIRDILDLLMPGHRDRRQRWCFANRCINRNQPLDASFQQ